MKLPLKTVVCDIETSPCLAMVFQTGKQTVTIDSLIPGYFTKIICISWRWVGETKKHILYWDKKMNDKKLLIDFIEAVKDAECIVGHNEKSFDIKVINTRIAFHSLKVRLPLVLLEDTLLLARKVFRLPSMKLAYLLQYFGIEKRKIKTDMSWWIDCCYYNDRSRLKEMGKYCIRDTDSLHDLYLKIRTYLPSTINYAIVKGNNELCPSCGGILYPNGWRYTSVGKYQRRTCKSCKRDCSNGHNLIRGTSEYGR